MAKISPTMRSLKHLRELSWHVCKVEQRIPHCFITRDAFNFGDLLAVHPENGIALVQVTSGSNVSARVKKARTVAGPLVAWLVAGGKLFVHGWAKRGARGAPKLWQLREISLTVHDLVSDPFQAKSEVVEVKPLL